ncbi:uncharacterized protein LOC118733793 [Rhagoletis pomonella]|uniref:uncharacterized protein LOC118733793 n=1 Tax=Rhagoletis pomonella TaxID=28610 RepID=UPI00177B5750|nr:uncharacterized protein LOC118733793 [Rhagoletis pomonella]
MIDSNNIPVCYIRYDVAHFIKKYAALCSEKRKEIKRFYLACIGTLILSRSLEDAKKILHVMLTVATSNYGGNEDLDGFHKPSACKIQFDHLMTLLSKNTKGDALADIIEKSIMLISTWEEPDVVEAGGNYSWYSWALSIQNERYTQTLRSPQEKISMLICQHFRCGRAFAR